MTDQMRQTLFGVVLPLGVVVVCIIIIALLVWATNRSQR